MKKSSGVIKVDWSSVTHDPKTLTWGHGGTGLLPVKHFDGSTVCQARLELSGDCLVAIPTSSGMNPVYKYGLSGIVTRKTGNVIREFKVTSISICGASDEHRVGRMVADRVCKK